MATNRYFRRQVGAYNPVLRPIPFDQMLQSGMLKQQQLDNTREGLDALEAESFLQAGRSTVDLARGKNAEYQGKLAKAASALEDPNTSVNEAARNIRGINRDMKNDKAVQTIKNDFALNPVAMKTETDQNFVSGNFESENYDWDAKQWKQITQADVDGGIAVGADRYAPVYGTDFDKEFQPIIDQIKPDVVSAAVKESGLESGDFQMINGKVHVFDETKRQRFETLSRAKLAERLGEYIYNDDTPLSQSDKQSVRFRTLRGKREGNEYTKDRLFQDAMRLAQLGIYEKSSTSDLTGSKSLGAAGTGGRGSGGTKKRSQVMLDGSIVEIGAEDINNKFNRYQVASAHDLNNIITGEGFERIKTQALEGTGFSLDGKYKDGSDLEGVDKDSYDQLMSEAKHDYKFMQDFYATQNEIFEREYGYGLGDIVENVDQVELQRSAEREFQTMLYTEAGISPRIGSDSNYGGRANPEWVRAMAPGSKERKQFMSEATDKAAQGVNKDYGTFNAQVEQKMQEWSSFRMGLVLNPKANAKHETFIDDMKSIMGTLDVATLRGNKAQKDEGGDKTFLDITPPGYSEDDFTPAAVFMAEDERGRMQWYVRGSFKPQSGKDAVELDKEYTKGKDRFFDINVTGLMDDITGLQESRQFQVAGAIRDKAFTLEDGSSNEMTIPGLRTNPDTKVIMTKRRNGIEINGDVYVEDDAGLKRMDIMAAYKEMTGKNAFANAEEASRFMMQIVESNNNMENAVGDDVFNADNFDAAGRYKGTDIGDAGEGLGTLSSTYESAGDATAIGNDSTGGYSYGKYQIATQTGTMKEYMKFLKTAHPGMYSEFATAGGTAAALAGSDNFQNAWKRVMSDPDAAATQHEFIKRTHFDPAVKNLSNNLGMNIYKYPKTVQDVIWSVSVQHGSGAVSPMVEKAIASTGKSIDQLSDEELINAIYLERSKKDKNGSLSYFSKSTKAVQDSVATRFDNELAAALKALEEENA